VSCFLQDLHDNIDKTHTGRSPMRKVQQPLPDHAVHIAHADEFEEAPACGALPTAKAVPDQAGRLWGWVDGRLHHDHSQPGTLPVVPDRLIGLNVRIGSCPAVAGRWHHRQGCCKPVD